MVRHVDVISVEEFVEAEEFTHDTVCAGGEILFENICWYRPRPLQARSHEWVSPMTVALRDLDQEQLQAGREMGRGVLKALGLPGRLHPYGVVSQGRRRGGLRRDRRPAAGRTDRRRDELRHRRRPVPGLGRGRGPRPDLPPPRASLQRGQHLQAGRRVRAHPRASTGSRDCSASTATRWPPSTSFRSGAPRRDWRATLISDGMVIVRHPELGPLIEMADRFARELRAVCRMSQPDSTSGWRERVAQVMPSVRADLEGLVRIPSVSSDPAASAAMRESADLVVVVGACLGHRRRRDPVGRGRAARRTRRTAPDPRGPRRCCSMPITTCSR